MSKAIPAQGCHMEIIPGSFPFSYLQEQNTSGRNISPAAENVVSENVEAPMPQLLKLAPSSPSIEMLSRGNSSLPEVLPNSPYFTVPPNALLPPDYQEIISYDNVQYLHGFLRTQIGKVLIIESFIGAGELTTRTGRLIGVGFNYILLQNSEGNSITACDLYSIRYVTGLADKV